MLTDIAKYHLYVFLILSKRLLFSILNAILFTHLTFCYETIF